MFIESPAVTCCCCEQWLRPPCVRGIRNKLGFKNPKNAFVLMMNPLREETICLVGTHPRLISVFKGSHHLHWRKREREKQRTLLMAQKKNQPILSAFPQFKQIINLLLRTNEGTLTNPSYFLSFFPSLPSYFWF